MRGSDASLVKRFQDAFVRDELRLSVIVLAEREFGVLKGGGAARRYAAIRLHLESRGYGIGPFDTLIAAQTLRLKATMVTRNTREFSRVPGLAVENWEK